MDEGTLVTAKKDLSKVTNKAPDWVGQVKEEYEQGASDVEVCKVLNITMTEFDNYYASNANFARLIDIGRMMSKAWWYSQGRKALANKEFNSPVWNFNMKNRFGWADKTENYSREDLPIENMSEDELKARIKKLHQAWVKQSEKEGVKQATVLIETSKRDN